MGYVPPHHNLTAVNYGNRTPIPQSSIRRRDPVQKGSFSTMLNHYKREGQFAERYAEGVMKRREIEQKVTGKGKQIDTLG
ncbi:hypothetical protein [Bacillus sp. FJAT-45350]|uniref:hypothetical protein n=1 Tax=Bacillus sp. FJAT-45350 TaxID=2011014 RepID=UPI000BB69673|nr:hypothetical protein [Bacillus sp. FJAT-45350]